MSKDTENAVGDEVTQDAQDALVAEPTEKIKEEEAPKLSKEEQVVADLQTARMGNFKVGLDSHTSNYIKNMLDKSEWKGPQQAYLLLIAKSEMTSITKHLKEQDPLKRYDVDISSASIESISFFMNNKTGKGQDAAQKLFAASMLLRPAMGAINELDQKLQEARALLDAKNDAKVKK